jgi:hypothetical protein
MRRINDKGLLAVNLAVVALAVVSFIVTSHVQPVYPFAGTVTDDRTPTFEWTGRASEYTLLIDDDEAFSSPMRFNVRGRSYTPDGEMDFGTYWWKVESDGADTPPMKLSIVSTVSLSRPFTGEVINSGNTPLLVHISGMAGALTLPVNESIEMGGKDVKAEQVY